MNPFKRLALLLLLLAINGYASILLNNVSAQYHGIAAGFGMSAFFLFVGILTILLTKSLHIAHMFLYAIVAMCDIAGILTM